MVYEFRKKRAYDDPKSIKQRAAAEAAATAAAAAAAAASIGTAGDIVGGGGGIKRKLPFGYVSNDPHEDSMYVSGPEDDDEEEEEDFDEDL